MIKKNGLCDFAARDRVRSLRESATQTFEQDFTNGPTGRAGVTLDELLDRLN